MTSSRFINPNGLPGQGQYTTARDLAVLAVTLKREFPQYASYFALEGFTTGKKDYPNYNMLIGRFDGADGMKTGFICASGFNQVSSASRGGRRVVSVVLGEDSLAARADESARLLQMAFTTVSRASPRLRRSSLMAKPAGWLPTSARKSARSRRRRYAARGVTRPAGRSCFHPISTRSTAR